MTNQVTREEIGTAKELNLQVGDVVTCEDCGIFCETVLSHEILVEDPVFTGESDMRLSTYGDGIFGDKYIFKVISRANPAPLTKTNELIVGETYEDHMGGTWEAIHAKGDNVWMNREGTNDAAYVWTKGGIPICLRADAEYNIKFHEPVVKTDVYVCGSGYLSTGARDFFNGRLTVTTIDGIPDWKTLKVVTEENDQ